MWGPQATLSHAQSLVRGGRVRESADVLRRAVVRFPSDAPLHQLLAQLLLELGERTQGLYYARRASELARSDPRLQNVIGAILSAAGARDEALGCFGLAASLAPAWGAPQANLGAELVEAKRVEEGVAALRRALDADPANVKALIHLAMLESTVGRGERAVAMLTRALASDALRGEVRRDVLRNRAVASLYASLPPGDVLALHEELASEVRASTAGASDAFAPWRGTREGSGAGGAIRIGFLSPDLREHAVANFLEPLLAGLRELTREGQARAEAWCFQCNQASDDTTTRLRDLSHAWHDVHALTDAQIAALVAHERIDVLVDLAGHTNHGRVGVMAMRPAPLQVGYLGYPATAGMREVDARAVDASTDPPGAERWHSERLLRLPRCFVCFAPPAEAMGALSHPREPAPPIATQREEGPVRFGSFSNPKKLSDACLALWSRVMASVPDAQLVLSHLGLRDAWTRREIAQRLAEAGIARERVRFLEGPASRAQMLARYALVDVALDTTPYAGTTTTCEALWMGVPVVTLAGATHAQRVGVSLLNAVGRSEWIASTPEQFVGIAAGLVARCDDLFACRGELRDAMRGSPLCDGASLARAFVLALEQALQRPGEGLVQAVLPALDARAPS
jgi:predicted O-linked N-acetylglucosamine transferase (SPINDLY family)